MDEIRKYFVSMAKYHRLATSLSVIHFNCYIYLISMKLLMSYKKNSDAVNGNVKIVYTKKSIYNFPESKDYTCEYNYEIDFCKYVLQGMN